MTIPVLIVGAGPIGLALAGDLGWRGNACTLIEKTDGRIEHPKMDLIGVRTMEFCRRWGIAGDVRDAPYPGDYPQDYIWLTSLNGYELGRERFPGRALEACPAESPQKRERVPQDMFDPIIKRFATSFPSVTLHHHTELVGFEEKPDRVIATVRDNLSGATRTIEAEYMVGTDGGASMVREQLGIGMSGHPALTYTTNVIFRCPNFAALHDKGLGYRFIFIGPEGTWLTIVAINGGDRFRMSIVGSADKVTHTEEDVHALLKRAMGKDFDYEILSMMRWVRRELVADSYGRGRVYLAGDAVHLTSPTGAMGMNTGMQDAVDLGWKLDAVLKGWAGPSLLSTYQHRAQAGRGAQHQGVDRQPRAHAGAAYDPQAAAGSLSAGSGWRRGAQGLWRLVHRADEPRVVHERLPSRLPLRRFPDRGAGRHAAAAARRQDLHPDGAAGRTRPACMARERPLDARPFWARLCATAARSQCACGRGACARGARAWRAA